MVNIITGKINSGKTTKLMNIFKKNGGDGIATIKAFKNKNFYGYNLLQLSTNKEVPFISLNTFNDELYKLDKFSFSKQGFIFAETVIKNTIQAKKNIYIDEIGPLELSKKGFYNLLKKTIESNLNIFICVRSSCLNDVLKEFKISNYKIWR